MTPNSAKLSAEVLIGQMLPSQARALEAAFNVHMKEVVRGTMDSRERVRIHDALVADKKCHAFRTIARIARINDEVVVNPLEVIAKIVAEDGLEAMNETNRALHNSCSLRGVISQGLDMQQQHDLPSAIPMPVSF